MIRIQIQILELPHKISTYEKANELKMLNAKVAGRGNGDNSKAPQKTQGGKSSKERSSFPFSFSCGGLWGRAFGSRANTPSWGYAPTRYQKIAAGAGSPSSFRFGAPSTMLVIVTGFCAVLYCVA